MTETELAQLKRKNAAHSSRAVSPEEIDRLIEGLVASQAEVERLRQALEESVKLQSHYAKLLNMHDGGHRIGFDNADEWLRRLAAVAPSVAVSAVPEISDIIVRLMAASVGHPHALIAWPHRLLHDAAFEISRLRTDLAQASQPLHPPIAPDAPAQQPAADAPMTCKMGPGVEITDATLVPDEFFCGTEFAMYRMPNLARIETELKTVCDVCGGSGDGGVLKYDCPKCGGTGYRLVPGARLR